MPDWREGNPYQSLLASALGDHNVDVTFNEMPKGIFSLNRLPAVILANDVIHLHWVNDLLGHTVWQQSAISRYLKLILLGLDILLIRLRGCSVVWTVHNLVSHESVNISAELSARRVIARCCSSMIFHSEGALLKVQEAFGFSVKGKANIIPHGNYNDVYVENHDLTDDLKKKICFDDTKINILFFGSIRRYKGAHVLVKLFSQVSNPKLRLIIAGKSNAQELEDEISSAAEEDSRIVPLFGFVPDELVASFFSVADAVILPFERTLTSGSTVLAMTMGKATILPCEEKVYDLADEESSIFFESPEDLKSLLAELDKKTLIKLGVAAKQKSDFLGWPKISRLVADPYTKK